MTTFKQLDAFVTLADTGTFEKAARVLETAQSAVSRHVSEFETDFEHQLLDRSGRQAKLTVDGADVLMQCRSVLQQRDAMLRALQKQSLPKQALRVGVTQLTALTWLYRFLRSMQEGLPQITTETRVEESALLLELLQAESLDAIVVPDTDAVSGVVKVRMGSAESSWYCSPKIHPGPAALSKNQLAAYTLLAKGNRAHSGIMLDAWLRYNSIMPRSIVSSSSLFELLDLLVAGAGIAYLQPVLISELLAKKRVMEVAVRPRIQAVNYVMLMRKEYLTKQQRAIFRLAQAACNFTLKYHAVAPVDPDTNSSRGPDA